MTCDWQELPAKTASRILAKKDGDFRDEFLRDEPRSWAVATADRFAEVFTPYLSVPDHLNGAQNASAG